MRSILFKLAISTLAFMSSAHAGNIIDSPAATQTIVPTTSGVDPLVINLYSNPSGDHVAIKAYSDSNAGGEFSSNTGVGISSSSAASTAGEFYPSVGSNMEPTITSWSAGNSAAHHFAALDMDGYEQTVIHDDGSVQINIQGSAEPSCGSMQEGTTWYVHHTMMVDGHMEVCQCNHSAVCSWATK